MKEIIVSTEGELRHRETSGGFAQHLLARRSSRFPAPELSSAPRHRFGFQAGNHPPLSLLHPFIERLCRAADLGRYRGWRLSIALNIRLGDPKPSASLGCGLQAKICSFSRSNRPTFSECGASGKPGAVQNPVREVLLSGNHQTEPLDRRRDVILDTIMISDTKNTSASDAAERIRAMILNGVYRPGQPLRQETLSEQLKISRTPLRHALQALTDEGLLQAIGYKGARVTTVDQAMVADLFEMRMVLEPMALKSAFEHYTKLDFAKAEMALESAEKQDEPSKLSELNWEFHKALYLPCRRQVLLKTIEQLNRASAFAEVIGGSIVARLGESSGEHRKLLQACRDGDVAKAVAILDDHLRLACQAARQGMK